ncbi:response regulator [Kouleothrix sp.]|uniref:response regulator n=1 Tax=Kouleothrix sp. TaxID=2779161 RepID=UPI00391BB80C
MHVLICDDQDITRDGLALLLGMEQGITVVGLAQDGYEAVEMALRLRPDLVLMDLKMPGCNGVDATRQIRSRLPETQVLVLTTFDDDAWLFDAIQAGAAGYLLKDTPRAELIRAVRGTVAGRTYVDSAVAGRLFEHVAGKVPQPESAVLGRLSERELAILQLIARGYNNAAIAGALSLSAGTVRNHVSALLAKLDVEDRTQAAVLAIRHGLR